MADLAWFEGVPSGGRWFCLACCACVTGLGELDRDEARALMVHKDGCYGAQPEAADAPHPDR